MNEKNLDTIEKLTDEQRKPPEQQNAQVKAPASPESPPATPPPEKPPMNIDIPGFEANLTDIAPQPKIRVQRGRPSEAKMESFPALDEVEKMIDQNISLSRIRLFMMRYAKNENGKPVFNIGVETVRRYVDRRKTAKARSGQSLLEQNVARIKSQEEIHRAKRQLDELFVEATNIPFEKALDIETASRSAKEEIQAMGGTKEIAKRSAVQKLSGNQAKLKGLACIWHIITVSELLKDAGIQLEGIAPTTLKDWVDLCRLQLDAIKTMKDMAEADGKKSDIAETMTAFVKRLGVTPFGSEISGFKAVVKDKDGKKRVVERVHKTVGIDEEDEENDDDV